MEYLTNDANLKWVEFYPKFNSSMYFSKAGYFDERPQIYTSLTQLICLIGLLVTMWYTPYSLLLIPFIFFGWGKLYINLPIRTGIQDCDSAAWGFNYHDNTIWIYIGGGGNFEGGKKWKTITMPWEMTWVRTSTFIKWDNWYDETYKNRKSTKSPSSIGSDEWLLEMRWQERHEFLDKYDGATVNATIHLKEMEWRPKWFKWTSLFARTKKYIEVEFSEVIGADKGQWKGGTIGCSYVIKDGESPLECLRRMEKERTF